MIDLKETGRSIAECRKEKKLTQKQLGGRLNVTDRAVSKWETGKAFPDVNILEDLCRELEISISELLAGKRIEPEYCQKEAEKMLVDSVGEAQLYKFQIVLYAMGAVEIILFYIPFLRRDTFLPSADLVNLLCWTALIIILGCGIYLDRRIPGLAFRTTNRFLEGAAGAVYFILFLALNFCVAGGQETISNTASGEKLMVGMTAAAGLAFVVAARVIQAGVKRKRRGKKDGVSSG